MTEEPSSTTTGAGDSAGPPPGRAVGAVWVGSILAAVVLVLLLVFILQNRESTRIDFLSWSGTLPTGIALLFAAVAGVLLVAIPGSARILQLRRAARRASRSRPA
ncbi:LapA family protein [Pseudonocardia humida]|uniref:DUF1049 domain-containing protein n=1 Tax=Pseudonocardia humida TaxID=2800819 RepID=A0ABT0ZVB1_9PSEU|nr:LapA family protein [Pseudonocardia humida]MCO1654669.1 DUF1049 domain-containing protein [Pseudonocardia humida]